MKVMKTLLVFLTSIMLLAACNPEVDEPTWDLTVRAAKHSDGATVDYNNWEHIKDIQVSDNNIDITVTSGMEKFISTDPDQNGADYSWFAVLIGTGFDITEVRYEGTLLDEDDVADRDAMLGTDNSPAASDEFVLWLKTEDFADGEPKEITLSRSGLTDLPLTISVEILQVWDGTVTNKNALNIVSEGTGENGKDASKIEISTAADFAGIMANISEYDNLTITLMNDINLNNLAWTPAYIDGTKLGNCVIVIDGNDHTISGLNVNVEDACAGLINGTWAGGTEVYFKNLTIADSSVTGDSDDSTETAGVGVFIGYPQASAVISFENCHIVDTSVEGGHWAGGFYGIAGGYNGPDGPVHMSIIANNCSVNGLTVHSKGSVGGFAGHAINDPNTELDIDSLTLTNVNVTSDETDSVKAGVVFGTLGCGPITVDGLILEGTTAICNETAVTGRIYGRQGNSSGTLTVDGAEVTLPGDGIDINGKPLANE